MANLMTARKRDLITVKISGKDALAMVMEIGKREITLYNMCTGRLCRVANPRPIRVPVSPVAIETAAIMTEIMETKLS